MNKHKDDKIEICNCNVIHEDKVNKVNKYMIEDDLLLEAAELLKVFSDKTRIKIINALSISEMCVCDLANVLDMTQSAISHQLRVLKRERLVKYRKEGKVVYYCLDDGHVKKILDIALEHVKE
jgi:ArsR family transcriptional regulator, lead/cadmium/zinc/bismuth-responsive transcriptional repressor